MVEEQFARTAMLIGEDGLSKLKKARVAVFGAGGVGGYVIEALARSGVGAIDIIDNDIINESNINRQIIATKDTIGEYKVDAFAKRVQSINPECVVRVYRTFYLPENASEFDFTQYSYVIDAIDTVTAKISLVMKAQEAGVPIISSMGTGNKLNPSQLEITDIYKTSVCPLAKVMRKELKARGIKKLKVLFSKEMPIKSKVYLDENVTDRKVRATPGSIAFVPSAGGLIIASEVVKDLII